MDWIRKLGMALGLTRDTRGVMILDEETKQELLTQLDRIIQSSEELKHTEHWKVTCQDKYLEQTKVIFVGELKETKKYLEKGSYRYALADFLQAIGYRPEGRDFDNHPEAVRIRHEILEPMGGIFKVLNGAH